MSVRGYTAPTPLVVEELIDVCCWFLLAHHEGHDTETFIEGMENMVDLIDRIYPRWRWSESLMPEVPRA